MVESSKLAVVIAAGGTAGHIRPALAVGEALRARGASVTFAGSPDRVDERELKIVRERRLQDDGATLELLGESLGISKERVRQIENRALEKLRMALLRENPDRATFI